MKDAETATLAATQKLLANAATEDAETVETQGVVEETTESQEAEETELFPSWEVELPDDLAAELDAPEVDDQTIQQELEQTEDWDTMSDQERSLLARATAAERRAKHFEDLRVTEARKSWVTEAEKFFPLSAHVLPDIKATSRTSFLKQAKEAHAAVIPYVKQVTDKAKEQIEAEKTKAKAEARTEAEAAWGKLPTDTNGGPPSEAQVDQDRIKRSRERGDLSSTIREMIFPSKGA